MHENPAELLKKILPMSEKRRLSVWMLQNHIFESFTEATSVEYGWNACCYQVLYDEYLDMRM